MGAPATQSLTLPDQDTYAREAIRDPHSTPPVLRLFAAQMARKMELALKGADAAAAFFPELESCAERPGLESVRATCAVNALRLGREYTVKLGEASAELRAGLSPEILQAVEASGY